jgi:S1-C subfamily serine protease
MNARVLTPAILLFCVASESQSSPKALTQKEACRQFMPAVVRVDVADGKASGFIVSADGWIVTAGHVVIDRSTGELRHTASVKLPDGSTKFAKIFMDRESAARDFALLKVDASGLPFLQLGSSNETEPGSELTLIGYPFSAVSSYAASTNTKFCLSTFVTATDTVPYSGVNVDAVYFQGPAVQGLSGGPLISRETGRVVGIQSQKMAAVGQGLIAVRDKMLDFKKRATGLGIRTETIQGGTNPAEDILSLINVLDQHLANGLGVATGADDAARFLTVTKRKYDKEQKRH